jgi:hypothetical protein
LRRTTVPVALCLLAALTAPVGAEDLASEPLLVETTQRLDLPADIGAVRGLLQIHLQSVEEIHFERVIPHRLNTLDDMSLVLRVAAREAELVEELGLETMASAEEYDPGVFDTGHLRGVHRFLMQWGEPLSPEEIEAERQRRRDELTGPDRVSGKQVFVEINEWTDRDEARRLADQIFARLASEEFHAVAAEHYGSVGLEYAGHIGTVCRGEIPDENFERLWNVPVLGAPCGPFETPSGFLILQIDERLPAGFAPADALGRWFEELARRSRATEAIQDHVTSLEGEFDIERIALGDDRAISAADPLCRIGDRTFTVGEARGVLPREWGDISSPRYVEGLRERLILTHLLRHGPASAEIHASPIYQWLAQSHRNAWLVQRHIDELAAGIDESNEAVERFRREHLDERYRMPDQVRVTSVRVPVASVGGVIDQRLARREAFSLTRRLREAWVADPRPEALASIASSEQYAIASSSRLQSMSQLPPRGQAALHSLELGETTEVLTDREGYLFWHLWEREMGVPLPLEEIWERLCLEHRLEERMGLREGLLGFSLGLEGITL